MLTITLEQFEGPLDLLLQLIEHEKLDITSLSLAKVTDQYFESLSHIQSGLRLDELAEFLVVASKLLLIKSHCLVPSSESEEEQEIGEFEERLRLYREFVKAGKYVEQLWNRHSDMYLRPRPIISEHILFSPPKHLTADMLLTEYADCIKKYLNQLVPPSKAIHFDARISMSEKMEQIRALLSKRAHIYFNHLISSATNRAEIIVSFLAILELVKQRSIVAHQETLFSEITCEVSKS